MKTTGFVVVLAMVILIGSMLPVFATEYYVVQTDRDSNGRVTCRGPIPIGNDPSYGDVYTAFGTRGVLFTDMNQAYQWMRNTCGD